MKPKKLGTDRSLPFALVQRFIDGVRKLFVSDSKYIQPQSSILGYAATRDEALLAMLCCTGYAGYVRPAVASLKQDKALPYAILEQPVYPKKGPSYYQWSVVFNPDFVKTWQEEELAKDPPCRVLGYAETLDEAMKFVNER